MKSVFTKSVYAVAIAILLYGITFQNGKALQKIHPSPGPREETRQTNHLISGGFKPGLQTTSPWNTFLGGAGDDRGSSLAMDGNGNSFVAGYSSTTWGNPVRTYSAQSDGSVAKLDPSGNLIWNTFLGGNSDDSIQAITLDDLGNVFVIGSSTATWGNPLQPFLGPKDDFVAKLDPSGNLLWSTFLGVERNSNGAGIVVDSFGNIYVNTSNRLVSDGLNHDTVIRLDSSGAVVWNILLGESKDVFGHGIALDENENVVATGVSYATWGNPITDFAGDIDAFVAKIDSSNGALLWNTFLGSAGRDVGYGLVIDGSNNIFMTGHSTATWGAPVRAYQGDQDGIVAKLSPSGNLIWNTFLGGPGADYTGYEIELDADGNIFVAGASNATWGIPIQSYAGDYDAIIVKLDSAGRLIANTFMGGSGTDKSYGIGLGASDFVYVAGYSNATWGLPVIAYTGGNDAFVAATSFEGVPGLQTVTKVTDTDDGACDSDCSLREAVAAASSASIISFAPSLAGQTIRLSATLALDKNLIIDGSDLSQNLQISGDLNGDNVGEVHVFSISANRSVEMSGITVKFGFNDENGGGILNAGNLTLKNCSIDGNRAGYGGGIYNSLNAHLAISNCSFSNNEATQDGGGIANYGNLEVTESTFNSNLSNAAQGKGSAIYAGGISEITGSTFYDQSGGTGTIYHTSTLNSISLILENSSFESNNTAVYNYDGKAALNNNTIYGNEGGIYAASGLVDISNSIVSHNIFNHNPTDCFVGSGASIGKDDFNFFSSDNNCSVKVSGYGVSLNSLANNGGPTKTMALEPNSPAINAGHDATCKKTDQRGRVRPKGSHCDIGSYEYGEEKPPMVVSITLMGPSPTSLQIVDFKVRFSEAVTGVNANDFTFTKTGSLNGFALKSITPAAGPADSYTVRVDTGKFNGTLRLNVLDNDSIKDAANDPLGGQGKGNGNFTAGQVYTVLKKYTLNLKSNAAQDGWILESREKTGIGRRLNKSLNVIYLGDSAQKAQYRSILSFNTKTLPDSATITKITLKLKKQGTVGKGDPVQILQGFIFDFKKGFFGSAAVLQSSDFQASANKAYGPFKPALSQDWYSIDLTQAYANINRLNKHGGVTQIRLRFKLDDNNNKIANYLKLYSGNGPVASRPRLIIEYYVP